MAAITSCTVFTLKHEACNYMPQVGIQLLPLVVDSSHTELSLRILLLPAVLGDQAFCGFS